MHWYIFAFKAAFFSFLLTLCRSVIAHLTVHWVVSSQTAVAAVWFSCFDRINLKKTKNNNISEATQSCLLFLLRRGNCCKGSCMFQKNSSCPTATGSSFLGMLIRQKMLSPHAFISDPTYCTSLCKSKGTGFLFFVFNPPTPLSLTVKLLVPVMCQFGLWECRTQRMEDPFCCWPWRSSIIRSLVLTEDVTNAWSCRSSPFSCRALRILWHRYVILMPPSAIETFILILIYSYYLFPRSIVYVFGLLLIYFSYPLFKIFFLMPYRSVIIPVQNMLEPERTKED